MPAEKRFTIGQFAKLHGVNKKTLMWYDQVGLLKPAAVSANGYRYYTYSQSALLETILMLRERHGQVRSIDIVNQLGYSKPSVSIAMKKLRENGYISMAEDGLITLTDSGMEIASRVYQRHRVITELFVLLGVGREQAAEDACRVEHDLSPETFARILDFVQEKQKADAP